jgi:PIN domain nuclease of toxin-antitoxin system
LIVLDTHIWLWWVNQDTSRLKPAWLDHIEGSDPVGVSAISCFEVAWLQRRGRITLPCPQAEWFAKALDGSGVSLLPITPMVATLAVGLMEHHSDPQDRIIIATAIANSGTLISADTKFPLYDELKGRLLA